MVPAVLELPGGWLTLEEAAALQTLAADRLVLEIGSYLGRSTVVLARVARHVVSVDHHRGSPEHQAGGVCHDPSLMDYSSRFNTLPTFLLNLDGYGVRDKVTVIVASSEEAGRFLARDAFDVVFVDGDHSADAVERDARLAMKLAKPWGRIVFHDRDWPGVRVGMARVGDPTPMAGSLAVMDAD